MIDCEKEMASQKSCEYGLFERLLSVFKGVTELYSLVYVTDI